MELKEERYIGELTERYPALAGNREAIREAYLTMREAYEHGKKILIAGNGGSAADCEHIAGELMKRFRFPRPVPTEFAE